MDTTQALRQVVATIAYRAAKVLRDVPDGFEATSCGPNTRRPVQIVAHMADLMTWGVTIARGDIKWSAGGSADWQTEVQRFFDGLAALDAELAAAELTDTSIEQLIQGPLADTFTHIGQQVRVRGGNKQVRIYTQDYQLLATHERAEQDEEQHGDDTEHQHGDSQLRSHSCFECREE